jgi:hypothetical protein
MLPEAADFKRNWQAAQKARLAEGVEADSYVYVHLQEDTDEPFYVGIGWTVGRPWEKTAREDKHKSIRKKHGMRVQIVIDKITLKEACVWEVHWIKALRGAGYRLANLTDGGEGTRGLKWTEEQKEEHKIRLNSPKTKAKRDATNSSPQMKELRAKNTAETWTDDAIREKRIAGLTVALNSEEYKIKRAETDAKPEVKVRRSMANVEAQNRPEVVALKSAITTAQFACPAKRKRHADAMANPEVGKKISASKTGEKHHLSKLSEENALHILNCDISAKELSSLYNVSINTIWDIRAGRSWTHLNRPEHLLISNKEKRKNAAILSSSKGWETRRRNKLLKEGIS